MFYISVILLFTADQLAKILAAKHFQDPHVLINKLLYFSYLENTGGAFGILHGRRWIFIGVGVIVILFLISWQKKTKEQYYAVKWDLLQWGQLFLLAGTLGNLIDRVRLGYVVDFIAFTSFPSFNLADMFINIGAMVIIIYYLLKQPVDLWNSRN
ncbi:MAG: signal peptidase II [Candidatus Margulisiibacteriota bacterium]